MPFSANKEGFFSFFTVFFKKTFASAINQVRNSVSMLVKLKICSVEWNGKNNKDVEEDCYEY